MCQRKIAFFSLFVILVVLEITHGEARKCRDDTDAANECTKRDRNTKLCSVRGRPRCEDGTRRPQCADNTRPKRRCECPCGEGGGAPVCDDGTNPLCSDGEPPNIPAQCFA